MKQRKKAWRFILPALLPAAALWFFLTHAIVDGRILPSRTETLDLRAEELTLPEWERLCARLPGCDIRWTVPLSAGGADSWGEELALPSLTEADLPLLRGFPRLQAVRLADGADIAPARALEKAYPALSVDYRIPLGEHTYPKNARELHIPAGSASAAELRERLGWFPALESVVTGGGLTREEQDLLREAYPGLTFRWTSELLGKQYDNGLRTLSFAGQELTEEELRELADNAFRFPALRRLDMTDCGRTDEELMALAQALPGVDVVWSMELYGVPVNTMAAEIDLSGHRIWDKGAALEAVLPCFPHLTRVIMSNCGLKDEEMDALNKKYENIRFVWTVYFSIYSCRTDATNFIAARYPNHAELYSSEARVLRYCTDLIALDLGHKDLTDISFLNELPHLQYLILVENDIKDLTPIGNLKELRYLEIFWTKPWDLTPLTGCTALQDLNISYTWARADNAFETLRQMPWLERLWYCGSYLTEEQVAELQGIMPECEMYLERTGEPTGGTWREHPRYFEMRDVFDMYYMKGGTNGVDDDGHQIVVSG